VELEYTPYVAPPSPPSSPPSNSKTDQNQETVEPDNEIVAPTGQEWVNIWRVIERGFNLKCVDYYDRDYLGMGELKDKDNEAIINDLIPNRAMAMRLAKLYVFSTGKTRTEYTLDIPPNLHIKAGTRIHAKSTIKKLDNNILITKRRIYSTDKTQNYQVSGVYVDRSK